MKKTGLASDVRYSTIECRLSEANADALDAMIKEWAGKPVDH